MNHNSTFHVMGRRNNITLLRVPNSNRWAATRTAPTNPPAKQLEHFDTRFVCIERSTSVTTDNFKTMFSEFHAVNIK